MPKAMMSMDTSTSIRVTPCWRRDVGTAISVPHCAPATLVSDGGGTSTDTRPWKFNAILRR